jgi:hypothetical protein
MKQRHVQKNKQEEGRRRRTTTTTKTYLTYGKTFIRIGDIIIPTNQLMIEMTSYITIIQQRRGGGGE